MGDKQMRVYTTLSKKKAAVLLCTDIAGKISQVFTGWYNSAVLKMPIPTFIEL